MSVNMLGRPHLDVKNRPSIEKLNFIIPTIYVKHPQYGATPISLGLSWPFKSPPFGSGSLAIDPFTTSVIPKVLLNFSEFQVPIRAVSVSSYLSIAPRVFQQNQPPTTTPLNLRPPAL